MRQIIQWDKSGYPTRLAVVELCGWCNKHGKATPMGKRIAATSWSGLTPAAVNVLKNHGIESGLCEVIQ